MKKLEWHRSKKGNLYIKWRKALVVIYTKSILRYLDWTFDWCKIGVFPEHGLDCVSADCTADPFADDPSEFVAEVNDIIEHPFGDDSEPDFEIWYNNSIL